MKTLKRINILVIPIMLAAMALPAVTYARVEEGAGVTMASGAEQRVTGSLEEIGNGYVTVGGQMITVDMGTEMHQSLSVGDVVEVATRVDSQGNLVAREIELAGNNAMDDHSQDSSSNSSQDDNSSSNSSQDDKNSNSVQDSSSNSSQDDKNSSSSSQDSSNSGQDDNSSSSSSQDSDGHNSHDNSSSNSGQDSSSHDNSGHDSHDD